MAFKYGIISLISLFVLLSGGYVFRDSIFTLDVHTFSSTHANPFSAEKEFPNYFAQLGNTPEDIQRKLEAAFANILERTVVISYSEEKQKFEKLRYFQAVRELVKNADPQANIYVSGGSIRSGMAYIYRKLHEGVQKNPPVSPLTTLNRMLQEKADLPDWEWRGVGSDIDLLLETRNESSALKSRLLDITNSAINQFSKGQMIDDSRLSLVRSVVLQGDVKDYAKQIENSSNQGGSTLDWLGFDLESKKIKNPARDPMVFQNFVRGKYSYIAAVKEDFRTDPADTILRGARPLFELPFLSLTDSRVFLKELETLTKNMKAGKHLSPRALGNFSKMARNSFEGGAHNRIYRSTDEVDKTLREASDLSKLSGYYIPEFADHFDRQKDKPTRELPADLKMPLGDFLAAHTNNGRVFHGTRTFDDALSILRSGFLLSSSVQGQASEGRGVYTIKTKDYARQHANNGPIFELSIRTEPAPTIVDWKRIQNDPRMAPIVKYAADTKRDIFEVLAREYGVDIVVHDLPLIQNMQVIKKSEGPQFLIESVRQERTEELKKVLRSEMNTENLKNAIEIILVISNVDRMAAIYGEKTQANIQEYLETLEKNLHLIKFKDRGNATAKSVLQSLLVFQQLQKEYRIGDPGVVDRQIVEFMTDMSQSLKTMAPPSTWQRGAYREAVFSAKDSIELLRNRGKTFAGVRNLAEQTVLLRHQEVLELTVNQKDPVAFENQVELIRRHYPEWAQQIQEKKEELFKYGMKALNKTPANPAKVPSPVSGNGLSCEKLFGP